MDAFVTICPGWGLRKTTKIKHEIATLPDDTGIEGLQYTMQEL